MRLPRPVVRVLPDDDDANVGERRAIERCEDLGAGRIDLRAGRSALAEERPQLLHVVRLEVRQERLLPALLETYAIPCPAHVGTCRARRSATAMRSRSAARSSTNSACESDGSKARPENVTANTNQSQ